MNTRGTKVGAGERNQKTRHPPRAPNLHGRLKRAFPPTGRRGAYKLYCQQGGIANENRCHI